MVHQLAAKNELVNWQDAPAEWEIANYDLPKIKYRKYVEEMVNSLALKSLRKRPFYTISTNVLCADITTSRDDIDPIERDLYLPLEIAIIKWTLSDGKVASEERVLNSKVWLINPGQPTSGSIAISKAHKEKTHKIDFDPNIDAPNQFAEPDLNKVMKEINALLTQDRTVFSLSLKYVRQDLGSLKWLNQMTGCKSRPINVYSLEDLYVVLIRRFNLESVSRISQGIARYRMTNAANSGVYMAELQCDYHQSLARQGEECNCCARALSLCYTNSLIDDVVDYGEVFSDVKEEPQSKPAVMAYLSSLSDTTSTSSQSSQEPKSPTKTATNPPTKSDSPIKTSSPTKASSPKKNNNSSPETNLPTKNSKSTDSDQTSAKKEASSATKLNKL